MDTLQIKLMYKEAMNRLHDADILSQNINRKSDSNYLLQLLAFELLLKATVLKYIGHFNKNHKYQQLFESLPDNIKDKLIKRSTYWSEIYLSKSKLKKLLALYSDNFIHLRYPFEAYKKMTEDEYLKYGNLWVELGAPIEEAEFQYYPEELYGLTKALQEELEA